MKLMKRPMSTLNIGTGFGYPSDFLIRNVSASHSGQVV